MLIDRRNETFPLTGMVDRPGLGIVQKGLAWP